MDSGLNVRHADIAEHRTSICGSNFVAARGPPGRRTRTSGSTPAGHGTHVTGTIVGSGFLSGAFAGMAPSVRHIRIAKVLDSEGRGTVRRGRPGHGLARRSVRLRRLGRGPTPDRQHEPVGQRPLRRQERRTAQARRGRLGRPPALRRRAVERGGDRVLRLRVRQELPVGGRRVRRRRRRPVQQPRTDRGRTYSPRSSWARGWTSARQPGAASRPATTARAERAWPAPPWPASRRSSWTPRRGTPRDPRWPGRGSWPAPSGRTPGSTTRRRFRRTTAPVPGVCRRSTASARCRRGRPC